MIGISLNFWSQTLRKFGACRAKPLTSVLKVVELYEKRKRRHTSADYIGKNHVLELHFMAPIKVLDRVGPG